MLARKAQHPNISRCHRKITKSQSTLCMPCPCSRSKQIKHPLIIHAARKARKSKTHHALPNAWIQVATHVQLGWKRVFPPLLPILFQLGRPKTAFSFLPINGGCGLEMMGWCPICPLPKPGFNFPNNQTKPQNEGYQTLGQQSGFKQKRWLTVCFTSVVTCQN